MTYWNLSFYSNTKSKFISKYIWFWWLLEYFSNNWNRISWKTGMRTGKIAYGHGCLIKFSYFHMPALRSVLCYRYVCPSVRLSVTLCVRFTNGTMIFFLNWSTCLSWWKLICVKRKFYWKNYYGSNGHPPYGCYRRLLVQIWKSLKIDQGTWNLVSK